MDENGKKPFYRRNWFWIMILSIFIVVSATTYVANYSYYKDKADQTTVSQRKSKQQKIANNPSITTRYNSIKTGKDGYSKDEVTKLLGEPTLSQNIDLESQVDSSTWNITNNNNKITIQITFQKNKATSKSIQGLDIDRKKLLTLEDYDKLQNGDNYNRVLNVLGDPDNFSDSNGVKTLTYESDLAEADPSQDATIRIEISNNEIISKSQTNLK